MGIAIADFNDDGWPDVFIANDRKPNQLFINHKGVTFEEVGLEMDAAYDENGQSGSSMGSDAKDFDNDGKTDIFYNNLMGLVWALLRNRGDRFQYDSYESKIRRSVCRFPAGAMDLSITTTTGGRIFTRRTAMWTI